VLQPHYNLLERAKFEGSLQDLCVARGVATVPYFALASGFLTGKYRGMANPEEGARGGAVKGYLNEFGYGVLAALDSVAKELEATPAQVALAWLASQPAVAAPIASATRVAQVEELLGAMRLTLTPEQLLSLDKASRPVT
jgi:aryl-alcohol dehydrogenase-like predicted oxidoreductase